MGKTENPTCDLSKFGARELREAVELLEKFADTPDFQSGLGNGIKLWFNMESGTVFLSDEEYNVAMLNGKGILERFVSCCECGAEGFVSEWTANEGASPCGHTESERGF